MSGLVDRRNQSTYWFGTVTWTRLKLKNLPRCSDCWLNVHAVGGTEARIPLARWRRTNTYVDPGTSRPLRAVLELCDVHRQDWLDWTPGQMTLGGT